MCSEEFTKAARVISHLKRVHFMIDNSEPINCIVRNCEKSFNTFKGLSNHIKTFDHTALENVKFLELS